MTTHAALVDQDLQQIKTAAQAILRDTGNAPALSFWRYRAEQLMYQSELTADQFLEVTRILDLIHGRTQ